MSDNEPEVEPEVRLAPIGSEPLPLLRGKRGLVLGVANHRSIAWVAARALLDWGAVVGLSVLDERAEKRAASLIEDADESFITRCDVQSD